MKVLFLVRSSIYNNKGGDAVQAEETAAALRKLGVEVDIMLSNSNPKYEHYNLLHFFNGTRPQDFLLHIKKSGKPYLLSPIYVDYSQAAALWQKLIGQSATAYIKALARWVINGEMIVSRNYFWLGHHRAVQKLVNEAAMLLPNSKHEFNRLEKDFGIVKKYKAVPNGVADLFEPNASVLRISNKIICVGRIEPIKNQLALIRALNNSSYQLYFIGAAATNHQRYLHQCKKEAAANIHFLGPLPQPGLVQHYQSAAVHVLPSWFETTGLSTLEAAACGCRVVIGKYGDALEYVGDFAVVCDPASPQSIRTAVDAAVTKPADDRWGAYIRRNFNWAKAAQCTLHAYEQVLFAS